MAVTNESIAADWATLNIISDHRCVALLQQHRWGRLAAALENWPAVLPMNYAFDGADIVMKTGPGSKLSEAPMTPVAFEIDDADPDGHWGWSVLVQGPAFDITTAVDETSIRLRRTELKTFAPGHKEHWIRVPAMRISGRSFGDVPGWDL